MHELFSKSNRRDRSASDFGTPASFELYRELMGIAEEIELCRAGQ